LLYGDTNSTLAGALAAVKLNIPLAHVEAGLRSFNMKMPEEINRILTDRVSDLLFCPTDAAVTNLNNEAVNKSGTIIRTGDIMADTLNFFKIKAKKPKGISQINDYVLCTIHRAENTDDPTRLKNIIQGLNNLHKEHPVILPVHPRTKNAIKKQKIELRVHTIPPVSYLEMLWLLSKSKLVITDSGGLQKEAYLMNKMCITLRQQTEWVELVSAGVNILSSTQSEEIVSLAKTNFAKTVSTPTSLYGDGNTAVQIVSNLNF
jgi:UDP-GlcNAc3NAcA epimerase